MKKSVISIFAIVLSLIIILSCTKSTKQSTNTTNAVSIANMQFMPAATTVSAGTTVTWTNNDNVTHTVTSGTGLFNDTLAPGKTFSFKFSSAGSYPYVCTIHANMTGTITVN